MDSSALTRALYSFEDGFLSLGDVLAIRSAGEEPELRFVFSATNVSGYC
jgi:hypothetical protein